MRDETLFRLRQAFLLDTATPNIAPVDSVEKNFDDALENLASIEMAVEHFHTGSDALTPEERGVLQHTRRRMLMRVAAHAVALYERYEDEETHGPEKIS